MKFSRQRFGAIGVDLSGREVKAVQLKRNGAGAWVPHAAALLPRRTEHLGKTAEIATWLRDVLERRGFAGSRVVIAAHPSTAQSEILELPSRASGAPVEAIARTELAAVANMEESSFEMACWDVPPPPRGGHGTSLLAVALRHADASAELDALEGAGFRVNAIDVRGAALARAMGDAASGRLTALVDLEWDCGFILFVYDGVVLFQRALPDSGVGSLVRAVQSQCDLPEDVVEHLLSEGATDRPAPPRLSGAVSHYCATLAEELENSLAFVRHRYPQYATSELLLSGAGGRMPMLCGQLSERLAIDVHALSMPSLREADSVTPEVLPALATAFGLALHPAGAA